LLGIAVGGRTQGRKTRVQLDPGAQHEQIALEGRQVEQVDHRLQGRLWIHGPGQLVQLLSQLLRGGLL